MSREMYNHKRKAIGIAKDFGYPKCVIIAIREARKEEQISIFMRNARQRYL